MDGPTNFVPNFPDPLCLANLVMGARLEFSNSAQSAQIVFGPSMGGEISSISKQA